MRFGFGLQQHVTVVPAFAHYGTGKMRSTEMPCSNWVVKTFLEIQRSRIRRPGEGRDPVNLTIFKSLGPGFRRDDEHFETSARRVKTFPEQ